MEGDEYFMNVPTWQSLSSAMEMQPNELSSSNVQSSADCFFNWEKSTDQQNHHFDSSMVSSPAASNSNLSTENFVIRELIGKLGKISPHSGYTIAPMNSPPKLFFLPHEILPSPSRSNSLNILLSSSVSKLMVPASPPPVRRRRRCSSRFHSPLLCSSSLHRPQESGVTRLPPADLPSSLGHRFAPDLRKFMEAIVPLHLRLPDFDTRSEKFYGWMDIN